MPPEPIVYCDTNWITDESKRLNDRSVVILRNQETALGKMDALRPRLTFRGKDIIDLYLLAAVVGDRSACREMDRPAIFFSTNKKEFQPKVETQAKMRQEFYEPYRMVWHDDFDLTPAVLHWQNEFAVKPPS